MLNFFASSNLLHLTRPLHCYPLVFLSKSWWEMCPSNMVWPGGNYCSIWHTKILIIQTGNQIDHTHRLFWSSFWPKSLMKTHNLFCDAFLISRHSIYLLANSLETSFSSAAVTDDDVTHVQRTQQQILHSKCYRKLQSVKLRNTCQQILETDQA